MNNSNVQTAQTAQAEKETENPSEWNKSDHFLEIDNPRLKRIGNLCIQFGKAANEAQVAASDIVVACLTVASFVTLSEVDEEGKESLYTPEMRAFNLDQGRAVVKTGPVGLTAVFMGLSDAMKEESLRVDNVVNLLDKIKEWAARSRH